MCGSVHLIEFYLVPTFNNELKFLTYSTHTLSRILSNIKRVQLRDTGMVMSVLSLVHQKKYHFNEYYIGKGKVLTLMHIPTTVSLHP